MSKKMRKFAGGGAMGGVQAVGQGLNQISESLGQIKSGLGDGGGGGGRDFGEIQRRLQEVSGGNLLGQIPQEMALPMPATRDNTATNMQSLGLKKGGSVGSASKRADGCAVKGKTRGRVI